MSGRRPADLSALEGRAIGPFNEAIKSDATADVYRRRLAAFLRWANTTADQFVQNARENPAAAQDLIAGYMLVQKRRAQEGDISASTLSNYRKPVRLLLEMNDVTVVNWRKLGRLMPSGRRYALDRAPTVDEVRLMLGRSDLRAQAIVLMMLSSGVRLEAWVKGERRRGPRPGDHAPTPRVSVVDIIQAYPVGE